MDSTYIDNLNKQKLDIINNPPPTIDINNIPGLEADFPFNESMSRDILRLLAPRYALELSYNWNESKRGVRANYDLWLKSLDSQNIFHMGRLKYENMSIGALVYLQIDGEGYTALENIAKRN
jgi:hypothetical protein